MRFMTPSLLGLLGVASAVVLPVARNTSVEAVENQVTPESSEVATDFMSVRDKIVKEYKNVDEIPTAKYFTESSFHYHYDGRFADRPLPDYKVIPYLSALIQTYLKTMESIGAETWIMHGTLLAWWWNQKVPQTQCLQQPWESGHVLTTRQQIFPWDNDLDVQISEPTIHFLADYYNMTEHHFHMPDEDKGRSYLLEINPHYVVKDTRDRLNVIDARWIDMSSGLFIDITAVRKDDAKRSGGQTEALMCKDRHHYLESQIWPLRESYFEDVPVKIPYAYVELLEEEYGAKSLTNADFHEYVFFGLPEYFNLILTSTSHHFNEKTKIWDEVKKQARRFLRRAWGSNTNTIPVRSGLPTRQNTV
ncbi:hypothetical protein N7532_010660 [Penicillium argentinense]|uniref:LicD/FKTN/FKRP nucleotidyltransferase domain-containing protein n=1 Tax=Penicillium argentinense TaxID=1131581 RepID=A0A9W9JXU8_9EURO|nr:uncharacterized protein N7532_010660 [Penicillium argentinense]KAJ5085889.1 hypothetical protein N7532_010660 [Penicillium argentinense]